MKAILFLISLMIILSCSKIEETNITEPIDDDLQGPISRPTSGYGADGTYKVAEISFPNPLYAGTSVSIFYPDGRYKIVPIWDFP